MIACHSIEFAFHIDYFLQLILQNEDLVDTPLLLLGVSTCHVCCYCQSTYYAGSGIKPTDFSMLQMIKDASNHPTKPLTLSVILVFDANVYAKKKILKLMVWKTSLSSLFSVFWLERKKMPKIQLSALYYNLHTQNIRKQHHKHKLVFMKKVACMMI